MTQITVNLFGTFSIKVGTEVLDGFQRTKVRELLCYLLINRDRRHLREALASLFWGESPAESARKYLRQTLWRLQRSLPATALERKEPLLAIEPQWVQLNSVPELNLDIAHFERIFVDVASPSSEMLDSPTLYSLQHALHLYSGDLLEGWYQDWCLQGRDRFHAMYLRIGEKLLSHSVLVRDVEAGTQYGDLILRRDRANEQAHRQLMRLYAREGNRTASIRQFERCVQALRQDLDVGPDQQTVELYRQICDGNPLDRLDEPVRMTTTGQAAAVLPELLAHLRQLEQSLVEIHGEVSRQIASVELALNGRRLPSHRYVPAQSAHPNWGIWTEHREASA